VADSPRRSGAGWQLGVAAGVGANVVWAANIVLTRDSIATFGPIVFACLGSVIAGVVIAVPLLVLRRWQGSWRDAPPILLGGAIGLAVNWASYAIAQGLAPVSHIAFLSSTTALFLIAIEAAARRRVPPLRVLAAAAIATLGVYVLLDPSATPSDRYPNQLLGDAFAVLLAASYALFAFLLERGMRSYSPLSALALAQTTAAPTLAIIAALTGGWSLLAAQTLTAGDWANMAVVQVVGGALAPGLFFIAIGRIGPVRAGMFLYIQPVLGALLGLLVGEALGLSTVLGGALIVAAVALSQSVRAEPVARDGLVVEGAA
jgi:drug/metabolite transporter (DMT)-like permease